MLISPLNGVEATLDLTPLFQKIGVAEVGASCQLMSIRAIKQLQRLMEQLISAGEIVFMMTDLSQSNQGLPLRAWVLAGSRQVEGFLRLALRFSQLAFFEQQLRQTGMTERSSHLIV